ncbi:peptidoglycan recognition protein family protein [Streptomonospora nanhaiensis]|uniref:peptidoglycan recognition protein family protein n=1 Tax=Streptomonospora nanhaiensis TaxID=1323731 RepID=UPI001C385400|nr:peptidoglycan-binding domain-containing protein [Streptomonospora nanhaiensis]MBV2364253.1 N-acetylmuramoyl-L-alanine amidase [Streptomonospora nanhaiensis]
MKLERRSTFGWGATAAGYGSCHLGIVIHYDSGNLGLHKKPHSACREYWKNTRRFHMGPARGWADIGYSFGVCPHGIAMEGRGPRRQQAAQPGGNSTWHSITLMTGPAEDITPAAIEGVRQLRAWLRKNYGTGAGVKGHRDFISTSCPGNKAYALVRNGTFGKAPGASIPGTGSGGANGIGEDDMVGLRKGDKGERVKYLQVILMKAGFDLPKYGADGHYGDETEKAVLAARKSQGSKQGFGDRITGWAAAQIMTAYVQKIAK